MGRRFDEAERSSADIHIHRREVDQKQDSISSDGKPLHRTKADAAEAEDSANKLRGLS